MHHMYSPVLGMSICKHDYFYHVWMWIWRGWRSPMGLYECGWHRDLSPMTRQVLAVTRSCVRAGMAAGFVPLHTCCIGAAGRCLLQGPPLSRVFWPGLPVTRTGISMHAWVFAGISALLHLHLICYSGLRKDNLLVKELLNLFLLNKELVRPKGEEWGNFPRREARKAHGGLLQRWIFPKNF